MGKRQPELTAAEFDVMKVLWRLDRGTVAEVRAEHERVFARDLAYTTVMTLLGRLAGKAAVKVDRGHSPYVYRPAVARESIARERLTRFVEEVFDGRPEWLVAQLVEDGALGRDALRRILRRTRARRR